MKKIYEIFACRAVEGMLGVEIEVDGKNIVNGGGIPQGWDITDDGSLRGRFPDEKAEFIFRKPVDLEPAKKLVLNMNEFLGKADRLDFSFRTSVHVHYNVSKFTEDQVTNMIYTYLLLEEPLMNYCGRDRKANRFCLRLQDADGLMEYINLIQEKGYVHLAGLNENQFRYASINIGAIKKHGSIEFRGMRGTCDPEILNPWLEAIHEIGVFAQDRESVAQIYNEYIESTPKEFFKAVLGKKLAEKFEYARLEKDMLKSFSLSIDLPFKKKMEEKQVKKEPLIPQEAKHIDQMVDLMRAAQAPQDVPRWQANVVGDFLDAVGAIRPIAPRPPRRRPVPAEPIPQVELRGLRADVIIQDELLNAQERAAAHGEEE